MKYDHAYWMDADERHADRPMSPPDLDSPREIELDDMDIPVALFDFTAEHCPAEPDVGIPRPYVEVNGSITSWRIGNLTLTRAQLVEAIGKDAVAKIESREEDQITEELEAAQ